MSGWSGQARPFTPTARMSVMQRAPSFGEPKLGKNAPNIHHFPATGTRRLHTERKYSSLCPALAKKLPMEVIFMIFEVAARSDQVTARSISLVCRHARLIAAPEVYRFISFKWGASLPGFLRFAQSRSQLCPSIRHLWLGNHYAPARLLAQCSSLERIALEPQSFIDYCTIKENPAEMYPYNYRPPLRTHEVILLSYPCDWSELDPSDKLTAASLQAITHLWLTRPTQLFTRPRCRRIIPCLSRITHLAIKLDITPGGHLDIAPIMQEVRDTISSLPALKMLVLVVDRCTKRGNDASRVYEFAESLRTMDNRVYVVPLPDGSMDFVAIEDQVLPLFKGSAAGRGSLWDRAIEVRAELGMKRPQSWYSRFI